MRLRHLLLASVLLLIAPAAFADCQNCVSDDGNNWYCSLAWTGAPGGPWGNWSCWMFLQGQYWNCYTSGDQCHGGDCECSIGDCRPCVYGACKPKTIWKLASVTTINRNGMEALRLASANVHRQTYLRIRGTLDAQ